MFYNGWVLFGALVILLGQAQIDEEIGRTKLKAFGEAFLSATVVASVYILFCGLHLAGGWAEQVAPLQWQQLSHEVHNFKGWLIVGIIYIWPYFLIVAGSLSALANLRLIARRRVRPLKRS